VATDIVARGIDVEALDHVVNFDVPVEPDAYIHRVGRTARAEMTGDAFTLFSPDEEDKVRLIERAVGKTIERRRIEGFDYKAAPEARLEVPLGQRRAEMRSRKTEERGRAKANAARRTSTTGGSKPSGNGTKPAGGPPSAGGKASRPTSRGHRRPRGTSER
jgi:ATP-dependent RNA helicase RhlE